MIVVEHSGAKHSTNSPPTNSTLNILYTENNRLVAEDKGNRGSVHDCIHHHAVADDDFVVKMTGDTFYSTTEFMKTITWAGIADHDCVIKFGSYMNPVDHGRHQTHRNAVPIHETNTVERTENPVVELQNRANHRESAYGRHARDTHLGSNEYFDV
jgi:hypothetical protein